MTQPRNQLTIYNKLALYLRSLKEPENETTEPEDKTAQPEAKKAEPWFPHVLAERLKKVDGLCFGFAVCDATFHRLGKADWWYELKGLIADWDGKSETLDKLYRLKDSEKEETLRHLFERALNYILFNFGASPFSELADFFPSGNRQDNFLKPFAQLHSYEDSLHIKGFELSVADEKSQQKVAAIKSHRSIGGHFEKGTDTLANLLRQNRTAIADSISIISNGRHSCALSADETHWYFYDSNDTNGKPHVFLHDDTAALVELIRQKQGDDICLRCGSYEKNIDFNVNVLLSDITTLLKNNGLQMLASSSPEFVAEFFTRIKSDVSAQAQLAAALVVQDQNHFLTSLQFLAIHNPTILPLLLEIAEINPEVKDSLIKALLISNKGGWTGLHYLATYAPLVVTALFSLAKTDGLLKEYFLRFLRTSTQNGWAGLHMLAFSTPAILLELFKMARVDPEIKDSLLAALWKQTDKHFTGIEMLRQYAPETIPILREITASDPQHLCLQSRFFSSVSYQDTQIRMNDLVEAMQRTATQEQLYGIVEIAVKYPDISSNPVYRETIIKTAEEKIKQLPPQSEQDQNKKYEKGLRKTIEKRFTPKPTPKPAPTAVRAFIKTYEKKEDASITQPKKNEALSAKKNPRLINYLQSLKSKTLKPGENARWTGGLFTNLNVCYWDEMNQKTCMEHEQSRTSIGGYFEYGSDIFATFLMQNRKLMMHSTVLIKGDGKTSVLCCDNNYWYFYDCRDSDDKPHIFPHQNTTQLVNLIHRKHGQTIELECVSPEKSVHFNIEALLNMPSPGVLFRDSGLHVLSRAPVDIIIAFINKAKSDPSIRRELAAALSRKNSTGQTGMSALLQNAPAVIPQLLELIQSDSLLKFHFAGALLTQNNDGVTILPKLMECGPVVVSMLFNMAESHFFVRNTLVEGLLLEKNNLSPFTILMNHASFVPFIAKMSEEDRLRIYANITTEYHRRESEAEVPALVKRASTEAIQVLLSIAEENCGEIETLMHLVKNIQNAVTPSQVYEILLISLKYLLVGSDLIQLETIYMVAEKKIKELPPQSAQDQKSGKAMYDILREEFALTFPFAPQEEDEQSEEKTPDLGQKPGVSFFSRKEDRSPHLGNVVDLIVDRTFTLC